LAHSARRLDELQVPLRLGGQRGTKLLQKDLCKCSALFTALCDENASLLLSGDHSGLETDAFAVVNLVSGMRPEPSAFITQMFLIWFVF
jgi:hypothetical protein